MALPGTRHPPHHAVPRSGTGGSGILSQVLGSAREADGAHGWPDSYLPLLLGNGDAEIGSIATSFPYSRKPGRPGSGQVTMISYAVPRGAAPFWKGHSSAIRSSTAISRSASVGGTCASDTRPACSSRSSRPTMPPSVGDGQIGADVATRGSLAR